MKELTTKQQREFWELCGLTRRKKGKFTYWYNSNDMLAAVFIPPIDLNNLFKYAVPEVKRKVSEQQFAQMMHDWLCDVLDGKDPALALFWVIFSALGGKK